MFDLDSAHVAARQEAARISAQERGLTPMGVHPSEVRAGDVLVNRSERHPWKGEVEVRGVCPDFTGGWVINTAAGPFRVRLDRVPILRPKYV